jgi:LacI family transcriptional regulator
MNMLPKRFGNLGFGFVQMVTLKDIAKKVGRSVTTVSRALHDYDDVSSETKILVRQVAEELGYTPNINAQRLQSRRSDTIGFVIPTYGPRFTDPFFSEFLAGIGNTAARLGYDILVSTHPIGEEELISYQRKVRSFRVDGFVIVRTRRHDARIEYLCESKFPFVSFGRVEGECLFPYVDVDNPLAMNLITRHLVELGHKRIAFIGAPDILMFAHIRLEAFRTALMENNLSLEDELTVFGDLTQKGGFEQAEKLLDLDEIPTAIVASNDLMALGAISAAQKRGLEVGKEIAIIGFDDVPQAELNHPTLTTIHQPIYKIGTMACEMLIRTLAGDTLEEQNILLKPSLIVRESCGGLSAT